MASGSPEMLLRMSTATGIKPTQMLSPWLESGSVPEGDPLCPHPLGVQVQAWPAQPLRGADSNRMEGVSSEQLLSLLSPAWAGPPLGTLRLEVSLSSSVLWLLQQIPTSRVT